MKTISLSTITAVAFATAVFAGQVKPALELSGFRAPVSVSEEVVRDYLWVEAEGFADYGEWRLDTQFTHKMGSAYLLAPGVCKPIGDARTSVTIPRPGNWRVWVRTKDWLPEFSPGKFTVAINGKRAAVLGESKREGWVWENAGDFKLAAGKVELSLVDLSGAFARCDAILLTSDLAYVPPADAAGLLAERRRFTGDEGKIADGGTYDVVVIGAGTAGMGASLAAARTGARTLIVHDRPVLGGNSSVELGIGTDGAAGSHPTKKLFARETGLCEEVNLARFRTETRSLSASYAYLCEREPRLDVSPNQRVLEVEKKSNGEIASVIARNTLTGKKTRFRARLFIDCTGDGWVGVFADAERMYGREAKDEFNEWPAPEKRDDLTMSGCLMDRCVAYRFAYSDKPMHYEAPEWARILPTGFTRNISHIGPQWWIEHGGRFDDLKDPERARDELVRISFAYWGWVKNESKLKDQAAKAYLIQVPFMNGRREGYRLVGDYILTANDALDGRMFEDRISYGGWPLDTHDPLGIENPNGNGYWKNHPAVPVYSIPYRCLYSRNIPNLMFAGRCQSVTHIALGSVRVEATLFTLGQAAGTAAALALDKGLLPREYGKLHIKELQQRLLKDDQYIPGLVNEDPLDLARGAKVSATSVQTNFPFDRNDPGIRAHDNSGHELAMNRATAFARCNLDRLDEVQCLVVSDLDAATEVTARVYSADKLSGKRIDRTLLSTVKSIVPPKSNGFVAFRFETPLALSSPYVWVELLARKGISWVLRENLLGAKGARAYGGSDWNFVPEAQYSILTTPNITGTVDSKPEYVIDGVARPVDGCMHGWISDPAEKLPQSIRLDFLKPVVASEVRLYLDTNLTPTRVSQHPSTLLRNYRVEGLTGNGWKTLAEVKDNDMRLMVHRFAPLSLKAVRIVVDSTWGDPSARVFEIRVY